jgi:hypothetical protein
MRYACRIVMCGVVMVSAVNTLSAQTKHVVRNAVTTKDKQITFVTASTGVNTPYDNETAGLKTIFSNLATVYPKGLYWCCEGATISGPNIPPLFIEWWHAAAFTPTFNATMKKVVVSIGYLSGNDTSVILSINADNAGIPGTVLEQWTVNDLGEAGTCCTVQTKQSSGVTLTSGQQYWIVASTGQYSDVNASWNLADNDQVDFFLNAGYTNQNGSNTWVSSSVNQNVVFGVFGQ